MQGKMYGVSRVPLLSDSNRRIIDTNGPSKRVYQVWRGSNGLLDDKIFNSEGYKKGEVEDVMDSWCRGFEVGVAERAEDLGSGFNNRVSELCLLCFLRQFTSGIFLGCQKTL